MPALHRTRPLADPGITRLRAGRGFRYLDQNGGPVRTRTVIERIRSLAIPPAWKHVWISRDPDGHIQAAGRDARNRLQYIYHRRWSAARAAAKYVRLAAFCKALPRLRRRLARDLACHCVCRESVTASVVSLIESGHLRIGNDEYTRSNGSYGATTLECRHLKLHGATIDLSYRGKSGIPGHIHVEDRVLARVIRRVRALPGRRLFQFCDDTGSHKISAADVNRYLHDVIGDEFTAKDFRTWAATLWCTLLLAACEPPASAAEARRTLKQVIAEVADHLGHTPTVCRASYVHPRVIEAFTSGKLRELIPARLRGAPHHDVRDLRAAERHLLRLLA